MSRPTTTDEVEKFCAGLTDLQLAECVKCVLAKAPGLDDSGREAFGWLNPRKSPTLKNWIYREFATVQPKPNWNVQVAADFMED